MSTDDTDTDTVGGASAARQSSGVPSPATRADRRTARWVVAPILALGTVLLASPLLLMPGPGLDPSWQTGLGLARRTGVQFGDQFAYTYGPWGWLDVPTFVEQSQGWGQVAFRLAASAALVGVTWLLARMRWGPAWSGIVVAVVAVVCGFVLSPDERLLAALLGLAVWTVGGSPRPRGRYAALAAIGASAGVMAQVKVSTGAVAVAIALVAAVGTWHRPKQWGTIAVSMLLSFLGAWAVAGQSFADIPQWALLSAQNVSGYAGALALYPGDRAGPLMFAALALAAAGLLWLALKGRDRTATTRLSLALLVLMGLYAGLKIGFVRQEPVRVASAFALLLPMWIWLIPGSWPAARKLATVALPVALFAAAVLPAGPQAPSVLDLSARVSEWRSALTMLAPGGETYAETAVLVKLSNAADYSLSEDLLAELRQGSVQVDPWETTLVWTYDLQWAPIPVFHPLSATTTALDDLNADSLEQRDDDQVILLDAQATGVDGGNPAWTSPRYQLELRCRYRLATDAGRWQVWRNTATSRCGDPRTIGTARVGPDTTTDVPSIRPRDILIARYSADVGLVDRLLSALYKPPAPLWVSLGEQQYRLGWGFADGSPLLMCRPGGDAGSPPSQQECPSPAATVGFSHPGQVTWQVIPTD